MTKESSSSTTAVQVALRIRPLTDRDRAQPRFANLANDDVLKIFDKTVKVVSQNKLFTFDHVFGTESTQEEIFSSVGDQLIRKFIEGYNITILAYGQTSSGKTYTMGTAANGASVNSANEGIVPRSMALLFDLLHSNQGDRPISPTSSISSSTTTSNKSGSRLRPKSRIGRASHVPQTSTNNNHSPKTKFTVKVSFIEIYNEDLHDLLNSAPTEELPPITIREDTKGRIYWTGVKEVTVHSTDDVLYYLEQGTQNRATGATDMNEKSSRSHAIFSVSLKQEKWIPSETNKKMARPQSSLSLRSGSNARSSAQQPEEGEWLITTSKFHFVDLAGSERLKRTAAEGDRRKEGININAGLLALGNVISALGDPSKKSVHVPYRDSKLTRLLQDSLGGSATTLMIACASPAEYNLAETVNTLQYANRARNIKNRSEKNQVEEWMTTENVELLRSIIGKLKNELNYLKASSKGSHSNHNEDVLDDAMSSTSSAHSMEEVYHEQRLLIADLQRQLEELDGEASVTRERNRMVEKELQRARLIESMSQNKQVDFQHLVEPVIEEYEKSVSKLESQLAMTKAALNHSEMGFEEQQTKISQLENLLRTQENTINELRLRLTKVLEREQNNESY
ncbi:P-loop containing nucleoside triphosphate hydrolase protein, partial [Blakeslea trispora]